MNAEEWVNSLTDEQRAELANVDEDKIVDYLAEQGVDLPDEALEAVAGGVPLGKIVGGWLKEKLDRIIRR